MANPTLEFAFSMVGLVFWSFQLAPQVWKSWRLKSTEGLSTSMMIIWALSGIFLGNYNIGANLAVPLWIQPQIFTLIAYMCAIQSMYYVRKWSAILSISVLCIICVISGAIEYGLVTAFQVAQSRQIDWVRWLFGVIPVVLIVIGFLPQYWEIFVTKRVHAFRNTFDALDAVNYVAVAVLDLGIVLLYYFFKWYHGRIDRKSHHTYVERGMQLNATDKPAKVQDRASVDITSEK